VAEANEALQLQQEELHRRIAENEQLHKRIDQVGTALRRARPAALSLTRHHLATQTEQKLRGAVADAARQAQELKVRARLVLSPPTPS
jgi:hypothetical protein